ncbi:sodium-coupled monocarboxylate transporter 1-like [Diaphorina citri]|uniref:Sodium-coupled monocarboxylate transporter 1-like n=1 Tax=Diaphorina citri TaxID=121845 RepID=A0A1S4EP37_DIACI|nr:sodium-coupled monocarboxylate transporter 1-like [Diaphorina citri]
MNAPRMHILFEISKLMTSTTQRLLALEDYIVFGGMLIVSCSIGIYYGCSCFQRKSIQKRKEEGKSEAGELLVANGTLGTIPVALSMLASFLSSITFIGQPAEVYKFGPQLWMFGVSCFFVIPIVGYIFVPFFQKNNFTSAYQVSFLNLFTLHFKRVKSSDELFPLYVMDIFHNVPGFPGLFLAGVFSAGLSTVSAGINSLSDCKFVFPLSRLLQITISLSGVFAGSLFALFVLGMFVPWSEKWITISLSGVFAGSLFALFVLGMFVPWSEKWVTLLYGKYSNIVRVPAPNPHTVD